MKLLLLSIKLFLFGIFCDICLNLCNFAVEKNIKTGKKLNKKLLIKMSNFCHNLLVYWSKIEDEVNFLSSAEQLF